MLAPIEIDPTILKSVQFPYFDEDCDPFEGPRVFYLDEEHDYGDDCEDALVVFTMKSDMNQWLNEQGFTYRIIGKMDHGYVDAQYSPPVRYAHVRYWIEFLDINEAFAYKMRWG